VFSEFIGHNQIVVAISAHHAHISDFQPKWWTMYPNGICIFLGMLIFTVSRG